MKKIIILVILSLSVIFFAQKTKAETINEIVTNQVSYLPFLKLKNLVLKDHQVFTVSDLRKLLRNYTGTGSGGSVLTSTIFNKIGSKKNQNNIVINNNHYLERYGFWHEKQLALFLDKLFKVRPPLLKNINQKGIHQETALYIAAARQMPHVVYILLTTGYVNPGLKSISKLTFSKKWISLRKSRQTAKYIYTQRHNAYPINVFQCNTTICKAVRKKLAGMTKYMRWCPFYRGSIFSPGECFSYISSFSFGKTTVIYPHGYSHAKYPKPSQNPYLKYKPAHLINISEKAPMFWSPF